MIKQLEKKEITVYIQKRQEQTINWLKKPISSLFDFGYIETRFQYIDFKF